MYEQERDTRTITAWAYHEDVRLAFVYDTYIQTNVYDTPVNPLTRIIEEH